MNISELSDRDLRDFADGIRVQSGGTTVIIGDTDTVAFKDGSGWQVAKNVLWQVVEGGDLDTAVNRTAIDAVIRREFPAGVVEVYYSKSGSPEAVVMDREAHLVTVYLDGGLKYHN